MQLDNEDLMGLGFCIFLLVTPVIFQQSTNYVANTMVKDRETKMKESLKIMGLEPWLYGLSILFQRSIWNIVPSFFVTLFLGLFNKDVYNTGVYVQIFFMLFFFGLGSCAFTMFVQNFFKDSKLVVMVLPFMFFIPTGVAMTIMLGPILTYDQNDWIQYLYFLPNFPFTVILVNVLGVDLAVEPFTASTAGAWVFLILQAPVWFLIHLYVEAIKKDAYGVARGYCFCLKSCRRSVEQDPAASALNSSARSIEMAASSRSEKVHEDEEFAYKRIGTEKIRATDPIQLKRVTMKFGSFTAVDRMSLSV